MSGRKAPTPCPGIHTRPPPPPAPPPKDSPSTLFGLPVVITENMPQGCEGDIILGGYVETYPLKMKVVGGKIVGVIGDPK